MRMAKNSTKKLQEELNDLTLYSNKLYDLEKIAIAERNGRVKAKDYCELSDFCKDLQSRLDNSNRIFSHMNTLK